jgi:hypothetical protein
MGIDVESRIAKLSEKLYMSIDVKSRKSILTEKLYTGLSFGVNCTIRREVVSLLLLMSDFETAPLHYLHFSR